LAKDDPEAELEARSVRSNQRSLTIKKAKYEENSVSQVKKITPKTALTAAVELVNTSNMQSPNQSPRQNQMQPHTDHEALSKFLGNNLTSPNNRLQQIEMIGPLSSRGSVA
tara:strand:- start:79 stop:411 length:333 start_codon:yes stop_codon:yes gene_type:complete